MRNLLVSRQWAAAIQLQPGEHIRSACVDPDTGRIFTATSTGSMCCLAADLQVSQPGHGTCMLCQTRAGDRSNARALNSTTCPQVMWRLDLNSWEEVTPAATPAGAQSPAYSTLAESGQLSQLANRAHPAPVRRAGHTVVTLAYAVELESVCVGTADGALVLLSADSAAAEQVGSVEGGVAAAAWSPGGDALLVVTGHGVLLLMNQVSLA